MKKLTTLGAALLLTTTAAHADGIDRSLNNYSVLFEDGNYAELSFSMVRPEVSGDYTAELGGGSTGNMSEDFNTAALSMKYALTPTIDLGLFVNQPYGAQASYPDGTYQGLAARWDANQIAVVGKYQVNPNVSVFGGVRSIESQAKILIPNSLIAGGAARRAGAGAEQAAAGAAAAAAAGDQATAGALAVQAQTLLAQAQGLAVAAATGDPENGAFTYTAQTEKDRQTSYILGAAYERPEIALRVSFTYESGYTHNFKTVENIANPAFGIQDFESTTDITLPDTYTLDFQTGVAADTLVFGSIRHATWADWDVRPAGYEGLTGESVTGIDNDVTTYRIGVGRKINDQFSAFARITYEDSKGGEASRLAPTDGRTAFGFGGTYNTGPMKITGGVEYVRFGDAKDASDVDFADNSAVAVGLSVGYSF